MYMYKQHYRFNTFIYIHGFEPPTPGLVGEHSNPVFPKVGGAPPLGDAGGGGAGRWDGRKNGMYCSEGKSSIADGRRTGRTNN